jgi:hypothetical protein
MKDDGTDTETRGGGDTEMISVTGYFFLTVNLPQAMVARDTSGIPASPCSPFSVSLLPC